MSAVDEIQGTVQGVAASVGPSVVGVGQRWGIGSGVVVAPGRVVTNAHNLRSEETTVTFADGRSGPGTVAGIDVDADIAVLDVETGETPALEWSEDETDIGAPVLGLSNPGGRGLRVTFGIVSGTARTFRGPRGRRITGSVEHTAPLVRGSSGGPLVDASGRLLGINTNRLGEGFYLAIPADQSLRALVDALGRGESKARPRLGVAIAPADVARRMRRAVGLAPADGLLIRGVEEGSPAERAGLEEGDLVVAVSGRPVADADQLYEILDGAAGSTLELELLRGSETRSVTVSFEPA